MAIDWIANKLYWTEAEYNWIEVSNLDGTYPTLLFWKNLSEPRDIAVNPIGNLNCLICFSIIRIFQLLNLRGKIIRNTIILVDIYSPEMLLR